MPLFDPEPGDLRGINAYYDETLAPELAGLESKRFEAVRKAWRVFGYVWAVCFVIAAVVLATLEGEAGFYLSLIIVIGGGAGAHILAFRNARKIKDTHKGLVLRRLTDFFGYRYSSAGYTEMLGVFKAMSLLPSHDRSSVEDGVQGTINGLRFRMTEAHLTKRHTTTDSKGRTRTEYRTVFGGALVEIQSPVEFTGETLLLRDQGKIFNFLGSIFKRLPRVRLEDPRFEERFEVFGSDQIASRYVLTPSVMERFLQLSSTVRNMTAAFYEGQIYCAFSHSNLLEVGSLRDDFSDPEPIQRTVLELNIAARLAEAMKPGSTNTG